MPEKKDAENPYFFGEHEKFALKVLLKNCIACSREKRRNGIIVFSSNFGMKDISNKIRFAPKTIPDVSSFH